MYIKSNFFLFISSKPEENNLNLLTVKNDLTHKGFNVFSTKSFGANINLFYSDKSSFYNNNDYTIFIHGKIYEHGDMSNIFRILIDEYKQKGDNFVNNLNGCFVIILIDKIKENVLVITDHTNSRKAFFEKEDNDYLFYSSLYFRKKSRKIDYSAILSFLVNGYPINNRTVFLNSTILNRATIYKLSSNGLSLKNYWKYEFTNEYNNKNINELQSELSELLIESVRTRLVSSDDIFLSLSAGYDATSILGIINKLGFKNVTTFSYKHGNIIKDSDEYISKQMANSLNYPHNVIDTFSGSVIDIFKLNSELGQCLSYSDDAIVWHSVIANHAKSTNNSLFVGDECLGWSNGHIEKDQELLNSLSIHSEIVSSKLKNSINKKYIDIFDSGLHSDINELLLSCKGFEDFHDKKDYLYLDQRLSNLLLNWRENFCGQHFNVNNPLLDVSILNFMKKIPSSLRRGKYLYKKTVLKMFPMLFKYPRATFSSFTSYDNIIYNDKTLLLSYIENNPSILDHIISPSLYTELLDVDNKSIRKNKINNATYQFFKNTLKKNISNTLLEQLIWSRKRFTESRLDNITLFKRFFVLRMFLNQFEVLL
jgi:hypothetical protein